MASILQVPTMILGVLVTLAGGGCGTAAAPSHFPVDVASSLVISTPPNSAMWEYCRNDKPLNVGQQPNRGGGWAEIRTYDRRRTSNGRPRESSTTYTRTLTLRGSY